MFLNLLANAMEHAPGSGTIEVDGQAPRPATPRSSVRDHGPGVAAKDLRTMFEPTPGSAHPHRAPGLGLGLYVAREIVTAHGGEIEATSRVGKGTS